MVSVYIANILSNLNYFSCYLAWGREDYTNQKLNYFQPLAFRRAQVSPPLSCTSASTNSIELPLLKQVRKLKSHKNKLKPEPTFSTRVRSTSDQQDFSELEPSDPHLLQLASPKSNTSRPIAPSAPTEPQFSPASCNLGML
jgi:hypothetical protein